MEVVELPAATIKEPTMKRLLTFCVAASVAAVPAVLGLTGNQSFAQSVPVTVPTQAANVRVADDHGGRSLSHSEAGDDSVSRISSPRPTPSAIGTDDQRGRSGRGSGGSGSRHDSGGSGGSSPSPSSSGDSGSRHDSRSSGGSSSSGASSAGSSSNGGGSGSSNSSAGSSSSGGGSGSDGGSGHQ